MPDPFYMSRLTKGGNVSRLNANKASFKSQVLIDKLVRFDIANLQGAMIPDRDIAIVLNRSCRYMMEVRRHPAYMRRKLELTTGIPISVQNGVDLTLEHHKMLMKEAMPLALKNMMDILSEKTTNLAEKKLKFEVSREILDREGSLPKISRSDIHAKVEHDYRDADGVSSLLLEAMGEKPGGEASIDIFETIRINQSFANSETLSGENQEKAMKTIELMNEDLSGASIQ